MLSRQARTWAAASFEPDGQHEVGTWTVEDRTGDQERMNGSDDIALDLDAGTVAWRRVEQP